MSERKNWEGGTEADVREVIVRPFLHRLGYRGGTENNIRTEVPLRYAKRYLGRKNPTNDPDLRGRADYICDAIPYGRWVLEAKASTAMLTQNDAEQAHSYAAHPEIGAHYYLLTNGVTFQLYATYSPTMPILEWTIEELESRWLEISNVLSPRAIQNRAMLIVPSPGKPLGPLLPSQVKIVGGHVTYQEFRSNIPGVKFIKGLRATITGDAVKRNEDGLLQVRLTLAGGIAQMDELNRLAGLNAFELRCADEFVSTTPEQPSVFLGHFKSYMPPGAIIEPPLNPIRMQIPFGMWMTAQTQAVGFFHDNLFSGSFSINSRTTPDTNPNIPPNVEIEVEQIGEFEIRISN